MFILNVKLAAFCLIIIPLVFLIIKMYRKYSSRYYAEMREQLGAVECKTE